jgi:hypothetical protein
MDSSIDNNTLSSILSELKDLNTNLSNGNLLGGDNRLFNNRMTGVGDLRDIIKQSKKDRDEARRKRKNLEEKVSTDNENLKNAISNSQKGGYSSALKKHTNMLNEETANEQQAISNL